MSRGRLHDFDGEQLTFAAIRERVPVIGETALRDHLKAGRNTTTAVLAFDPAAASRRGAVIAAARARASGNAPRCAFRSRTPYPGTRTA